MKNRTLPHQWCPIFAQYQIFRRGDYNWLYICLSIALIQFSLVSFLSCWFQRYFSFKTLVLISLAPIFLRNFAINFKLRTSTTMWKKWGLSTYESLVYSPGFRESKLWPETYIFMVIVNFFFDLVCSRISIFLVSNLLAIGWQKEGNSFYRNKILTSWRVVVIGTVSTCNFINQFFFSKWPK